MAEPRNRSRLANLQTFVRTTASAAAITEQSTDPSLQPMLDIMLRTVNDQAMFDMAFDSLSNAIGLYTPGRQAGASQPVFYSSRVVLYQGLLDTSH